MENKTKKINLIIPSIIIAIAILDLGLKISSGLNNISETISYKSDLMDSTDPLQYYNGIGAAASYLGMTKAELKLIIENENSNIPYIKVGDKIIFYKDALDEWLKTSRINISK
jgi:hypothetical protein